MRHRPWLRGAELVERHLTICARKTAWTISPTRSESRCACGRTAGAGWLPPSDAGTDVLDPIPSIINSTLVQAFETIKDTFDISAHVETPNDAGGALTKMPGQTTRRLRHRIYRPRH